MAVKNRTMAAYEQTLPRNIRAKQFYNGTMRPTTEAMSCDAQEMPHNIHTMRSHDEVMSDERESMAGDGLAMRLDDKTMTARAAAMRYDDETMADDRGVNRFNDFAMRFDGKEIRDVVKSGSHSDSSGYLKFGNVTLLCRILLVAAFFWRKESGRKKRLRNRNV
jgi:hypothetical protein